MATKYVLIFVSALLLSACGQKEFQPNPDPNHTHADFAVWILDEQVDFSLPQYMSGLSTDDSTHDEANEYHHQHLHLHDNVGHVMHRHKPGLTVGEFFFSLGFAVTNECVTADTGEEYCNEEGKRWRFFVNGREQPLDPDYIFKDMDKLLLTYAPTHEQLQRQQAAMTDDACLYSRTCPWRGDPPSENCIADPEVPCVPTNLDKEYEDL